MVYRARPAHTRTWAPINTSTQVVLRRGHRRNRAIHATPRNHFGAGAEVMIRRGFSARVLPALVAAGRISVAAQVLVAPPADYVIGLDDVLTVTFWREQNLSSDVVVRPDGKITLPLMNDVE